MQWYHSGPSGVTTNKVYGPQFGETTYITEVNRAGKVKSNAQVAMNKISDPMQTYFSTGVAGGQCPNSKFSKLLKLSKTICAGKVIFGEQVVVICCILG